MPEDKDGLNEENRENDPDDKNEQNGKETKKEKKKWKKKLKLQYVKVINKSKHVVKDLEMKIFHNKKKLPDNVMPSLLPITYTTDLTDSEESDEEESFLEEVVEEWFPMARRLYSGCSTDWSREVVEALYMALKQCAFKMIKDSISRNDENQLKEAIRAIEDIKKQEHKDPNQPLWSWKTEWEECVVSSVTEQVDSLPKFSRENPDPCLGTVLGTLGKTMKSGLTHVIENLKPHYPENFDVGNTYALQYHQKLQSKLSLITEYELSTSEIHVLLSFTQSIYPNILRDPVLINHINVVQLEELLPSEKVCHLENMYIRDQKEELEQWMTITLRREEDQWKEGRPPEMLGSVFHSALSEDILKMYDSKIKAAEEISEHFANKLTPNLANVFLEFLQRYKSSIDKHCELNKSKPHFMDIIIANLNGCNHFRVCIERTSVGEDVKQKIYSILSEIEDQGFGILLKNFFQEIQFRFREISRMKGLQSAEIMSEIITVSREYVSSVTTLSASCRQVMAGRVHMDLVIKYLTYMKDIRQCNMDEQNSLAAQMHRTADLLHHFCTDHLSNTQMSKATWANGAIRKIAEIVRLQDLAAIKHDVCVLTSEYPDIRNSHVKSFLCIKNTLNMCEKMSVVKIMKGIKREDPLNRELFTFIPMPCCCLIF